MPTKEAKALKPCPDCLFRPLHVDCDPALCCEAPREDVSSYGVWGWKLTSTSERERATLQDKQILAPKEGHHLAKPCELRGPWTNVVNRANRDCPTSQILENAIYGILGSNEDTNQHFSGLDLVIKRSPAGLEVSWEPHDGYLPKFEFLQSARTDTGISCKLFPVGTFKVEHTGSASALQVCRRCIEDCVQNHPLCTVTSSKLPHRVIDISHISNGNFMLKLYESENEEGEYAALSHCWGKTQLLRTTTENLRSFQLAIPWRSLSQAFKDAIVLTRELGLKYIWIDSLCIIQDDLLDWENESSKMGNIYGSSKFVIAAVRSKDGDGGCFTEDNRLILETQAQSTRGPVVTARKLHSHTEYRVSYRSNKEKRPPFSRAWTFQEELLAPRMLYCDSTELVFQCRQSIDCECGRIKNDFPSRFIDTVLTAKHEFETSREANVDTERLLTGWARIVTQYSARSLTKETDRLPALSGLAKKFEGRGLGLYVAGIWTNDLLKWLEWISQRRKIAGGAFVAPSWSWASASGSAGVSFPRLYHKNQYEHEKAKILGIKNELAGSDTTGAIKLASLLIRGHIVSATLRFWPIGPGWRLTIQQGRWEAICQPLSMNMHPDRASEVFLDGVPCVPSYKKTALALDGQSVLCLLLRTDVSGLCSYLLITPGEQCGQYRRIGLGFGSTVYLIEDCDRLVPSRIDFNYEQIMIFEKGIKRMVTFESWFHGVEEREITLV